MSKRLLEEKCNKQLDGCSPEQILDIMVVLAPQLPTDVQELLNKKMIEIKDIPKSQKRHAFSSMAKTTKQRKKDMLLSTFNKYGNEVAVIMKGKNMCVYNER